MIAEQSSKKKKGIRKIVRFFGVQIADGNRHAPTEATAETRNNMPNKAMIAEQSSKKRVVTSDAGKGGKAPSPSRRCRDTSPQGEALEERRLQSNRAKRKIGIRKNREIFWEEEQPPIKAKLAKASEQKGELRRVTK